VLILGSGELTANSHTQIFVYAEDEFTLNKLRNQEGLGRGGDLELIPIALSITRRSLQRKRNALCGGNVCLSVC
jgi:hypothetical protein